MKRIIITATLALIAVTQGAWAQEDDGSIGAAYQLYNEAVAAGDSEATLRFAQLAYERGREEWAADNVQLGFLAANYGEALSADGQYRPAVAAYEQCIDILEEQLPETRIDLASCWRGLSLARLYRGQGDKALDDLGEVIALLEQMPDDPLARRMMGDAHFMSANILVPKESFYFREEGAEEHFEQAASHAMRAMPLIEEAYGAVSEGAAQVRLILGIEKEADAPEEALDYYRQALALMRQAKGDDDPETLWARLRVNALDIRLRNPDAELDRYENPIRCRRLLPDGRVAVSCPSRRYPPEFPERLADLEGTAVVEMAYDIDQRGRVTNVRTVYANHEGFVPVSEETIGKWRYDPPVDENGTSVSIPDNATFLKYKIRR